MKEAIKSKIEQSIQAFSSGNLTENALRLFDTLGYITSRRASLAEPDFESFKSAYVDPQSKTFSEKKNTLVEEWKYVDLLFQLSKEEAAQLNSLFDTKQVDNTVIESYLFFTIELKVSTYTRTALSNITREINRLFPMPVMILFKHGDALTLSIINRRLHKRDKTKDVLEKITLIKDISITNPHRAHIEILYDLTFDDLYRRHQFTNFVELHDAWQKTLDTKELNRRFYNDLANWYFWALDSVEFPKDAPKDKDGKHPVSLIRLITRIIFVWFIKEKELIPDSMFNERELKSYLIGFKPEVDTDRKSTFYRAILQNLFFATLNTEMKDRGWARDGQNMMAHSLYRYKECFTDPEKALILFSSIPFLNGGLFECLDKTLGTTKGPLYVRIDGFSRRIDSQPTVPDFLFFGKERVVDLTGAYGDKKHKSVKVKGLIHVLNHYKFTVTENTPIEEEIALDPELLGRVFENLLANYNPETKNTARKQTGSFYTPREIVNYMVDESLKAYLKQKLVDEAKMADDDAEIGLEFLICYSEKENLFDKKQTQVLINAIDNCKILDPACGSGAFPMGVLHKMVHILHRIDHRNAKWKQRQIEKAEAIDHLESRENAVRTLEDAFENNELDFPRKLYLIENCIYGVDIQPIAVQIAKLRFFISLIVDQKVNKFRENLGVLPLPNLETKFVAANTLIGIQTTEENMGWFENEDVQNLQRQLQNIRHKMFSARTPKSKRSLREKDESIRKKMADRLEVILNREIEGLLNNRKEKNEVAHFRALIEKKGENKEYLSEIKKRLSILDDLKESYVSRNNRTAQQLAAWDPYDQNASASFFDSDWMFGIGKGFDVVIGNPPYVPGKNLGIDEKKILHNTYKLLAGKYDLYIAFIERGMHLIKRRGCLVFIIPNAFLTNENAFKIRKYIVDEKILSSVRIYEDQVFEATVESIVLLLHYNRSPFIQIDELATKRFPIDVLNVSKDKLYRLNTLQFGDAGKIISKIEAKSIVLGEISDICIGIQIGGKGKSSDFKKKYISNSSINKLYKPIIDGKNIVPYKINWDGKYLKYGDWLHRKRDQKYFLNTKILVRQIGSVPVATIDYDQYYTLNTIYNILITSSDYLPEFVFSIINSSCLKYYWKQKLGDAKGFFPKIKKSQLVEIPICKSNILSQKLFVCIVKYIMHTTGTNNSYNIFESLINAMVYELYFPDEIKAADAEVLTHLTNLPELKDNWGDKKNLAVVQKVHEELSDPKHPISIAMFKMDSIEEIRIIEGKE